jgi:putative ABC transport system substrate-binding protein
MKRREFITLIGGAAASWPFSAMAQQSMPVIGFLSSGSPESSLASTEAFRHGLGTLGYVEGHNVAIEYLWSNGQYARLPAFAADLASRRVSMIFAGGPPAAIAAKEATATIPIVFTSGGDPVETGLVASLNKPGGNITGISLLTAALEAKRLGLLREILPNPATIAVLVNPKYPGAAEQLRDLEGSARQIGQRILVLNASTAAEIDTAFAAIAQKKPGGLLVCADPFFSGRRQQIVLLATRSGVPAIYERREVAEAGGLMSYGISISNGYRQAGMYAGRILKGERPADLPVIQSAVFELIVNLVTAKALAITVPPGLLARADEVIE